MIYHETTNTFLMLIHRLGQYRDEPRVRLIVSLPLKYRNVTEYKQFIIKLID